jgi:FixJ family two-component response regulator
MATAETVYIIDDDESMRFALDSLFRSVHLNARVYASPQEFLSERPERLAGCMVLDVQMPDGSGLEFQERLNDYGIHLPIVFLTGYGDIPTSVRGMKAGAVDFLTKPFNDQELLDAVEDAFNIDRKKRKIEEERSALKSRFDALTRREHEVMKGVTAGRMNKQVAGDLGLSEITVKLYRKSAMQKMGARTLAELVLMSAKIKSDSDRPSITVVTSLSEGQPAREVEKVMRSYSI